MSNRGHDNHGATDDFITVKATNMDVETNDGGTVTFERGFWTGDTAASRLKETGHSCP
jgi:hypothetical protein